MVKSSQAISGHNRRHLQRVTVAACKAACLANAWCKSCDYKGQAKCDLGDKIPKPGVPGRVATKTLQPRQSLRPLLHRVASGRACRPTCLCFFLACHLVLLNGQQRSIVDALREDTHAHTHTQFVSTDHVHKARDLFRPARTSLYSDCAAVNDVIMCLAR